ncbi:toxin-antitoxin system YwqK family antitoxin [Rossellomorea sp. H39__3]
MEELLTKEYVLRHGVEFETQLEYGGPYGQGIVYIDHDGKEHLFTGLAYDLHPNGKLESYFYVDEGVKEGRYVEFYPSGAVESIRTMHKSALMEDNWSSTKTVEYAKNLRVSLVNASRIDCMIGMVR